MASGSTHQGFSPEPGRVLYLDYESDVQDMMEANEFIRPDELDEEEEDVVQSNTIIVTKKSWHQISLC